MKENPAQDKERRIALRVFTPSDIPFGMMLKERAGWNQLPGDWERLIALEPEGCFVARYDGRDAGTVTLTGYQQRFGWVGMVLVHPDLRRKGIGTALLLHGIRILEQKRGVSAVRLDATPAGKQLYETIGFVEESVLERRQGIGLAMAISDDLPTVSDVLDRVCDYDAPVFGADRSRVLRHLASEPEVHSGVSLDARGEIQGYVMVRRGACRHYIGPWVAENADIARQLWRWALSRIPLKPFFVDIRLDNPAVEAIVPKDRFPVQRRLIRMFRGENRTPGRTRSVFGISGPEMG
jgi:GNAT superfamily N-acetyltransferase